MTTVIECRPAVQIGVLPTSVRPTSISTGSRVEFAAARSSYQIGRRGSCLLRGG